VTAPGKDEERTLLLGAYLDGEIDPLAARTLEGRLDTDSEAAAELAEIEALRRALRADRSEDLPSEDLRKRVEAVARPPRLRERTWSWQALAASALIGAVLSGAGVFGALTGGNEGDAAADAVVASHIRALMAPQPIDVASSDRHTVKPWFDGKLAFAPEVVDLAAKGFPLVGGRVDVVDFQPVATLVYQAGRHLISLTVIPRGKTQVHSGVRDDRGFHTVTWSGGAFDYIAVSDAAPEALSGFVDALRGALGQG
jgi:anti-sigma factor RsiW